MIPAFEPIPPEANALRRIRNSEIASSSGRIRKGAFLPSKSGKDRDGLSVSIENAALKILHQAKYEDGDHRACYLTVGSVRELKPLDVEASPVEDDPAHALIVGIPDRTLGINEREVAEHLASELAKRAIPYTFPPRVLTQEIVM
jgi:hypothetical protein